MLSGLCLASLELTPALGSLLALGDGDWQESGGHREGEAEAIFFCSAMLLLSFCSLHLLALESTDAFSSFQLEVEADSAVTVSQVDPSPSDFPCATESLCKLFPWRYSESWLFSSWVPMLQPSDCLPGSDLFLLCPSGVSFGSGSPSLHCTFPLYEREGQRTITSGPSAQDLQASLLASAAHPGTLGHPSQDGPSCSLLAWEGGEACS